VTLLLAVEAREEVAMRLVVVRLVADVVEVEVVEAVLPVEVVE
jgi:hypothetical protein